VTSQAFCVPYVCCRSDRIGIRLADFVVERLRTGLPWEESPIPADTIEFKGGAASGEAPTTRSKDAAADHDATRPRPNPGSKPTWNLRITRRQKVLIGLLCAAIVAAAAFGIPWIRFVLSTVSTDDAFVNGHVTFVAPRVHGQVSRVLVDDNNRVHKGDLLVELDKEPLRDAVAVKRAAVDTAEADLQAARAAVRGIEAQARSRRWQLQQAIQNVENQIGLLHARVAALKKAKATLMLGQQEFDRTSQLVLSETASRELYDQRRAALLIAQAGVVQALASNRRLM
jgi:membrane fusion protein, multidrug efflux system